MNDSTTVTPYKGDKPYIFISYAHKDKAEVLPVIERMQQDGYRVWYDEGIDPGSEWDENIASHVEACELFIAFMSDKYLSSSNCKDELNYARDREKKRILVYIEDVELPSGMRMRLSRLQNIHKYTYASTENFFQKLYETDGIEDCHTPIPPQPNLPSADTQNVDGASDTVPIDESTIQDEDDLPTQEATDDIEQSSSTIFEKYFEKDFQDHPAHLSSMTIKPYSLPDSVPEAITMANTLCMDARTETVGKRKNLVEAEKDLLHAIRIFEHLASNTSADIVDYWEPYINACVQLASFYENQNSKEQSNFYYLKAIDIYKQLDNGRKNWVISIEIMKLKRHIRK